MTTPKKRYAVAARVVLTGFLAVAVLAGCTSAPAIPEPPTATATPAVGGFDAATRDDAAFSAEFSHRFADVDGVRMHYVSGGSGPPLVLLHGWPQSWYEWREIMPKLAERYTVYALDLPGLGDSEGAPPSYDKATLARYVHRLLADQLGLGKVRLAAHDLGAGVGHQYAAQFPDGVAAYAHVDYPLPGPALAAKQYRTFSWHLPFHNQPGVPELLVDDEVRSYLAAFYPQVAYGGSAFGGSRTTAPFPDKVIDEFARTYARPQVLHGGFELYRNLDEDELDNTVAGPTRVPTMLVTAEGLLATTAPTVAPLVSDLRRTVEIRGAGHWLAEEAPDALSAELLSFFASVGGTS